MSKSIAEILQEVENRGELEALNVDIRIAYRFTNQFQGVSVENYNDGEGFCFENRLYIRWQGGWYDGTNHPQSPYPELRDKLPGYHIADIKKRRFGSFGKIQEEVEECLDAHQQGSHIMMLVELSDLYGAMEGFLAENYPGFTMSDLAKFSSITGRAFRNGYRG
ncbi:hypothetical protein POP15_225 [Pectobacterium phage POP15]|nr:hypothetical protein POP15_225 [Pectobacterium phage POP15]